MKKILTVIGARPQIIKAAAISRAIKSHFSNELEEVILHTGQHYDQNMSQVFFEELQIPPADIQLSVGSGKHGEQTAKMIAGIEKELLEHSPSAVLLYGDTNSTLAGAIAASKLHIPVVHVEAGLRSFNKSMPEEINRIMCDHVSTLLFSPTRQGLNNLLNEGFQEDAKEPYNIDNPRIYHSGDVMYDNSLFFSKLADDRSEVLKDLGDGVEGFILATVHRDHNTDDPARLTSIFEAFIEVSEKSDLKIVLPLHPRTRKMLPQNLSKELLSKIESGDYVKMIPPVSFLDMVMLEKKARLIITDSGGVQKEAYFFKKGCVILRPQTEWVELVEQGAAVIADADKRVIVERSLEFLKESERDFPEIFGDGHAAEFICREMIDHLS
ncbi:non-hydrolyzing UDP-N-acetylglucosamine 2-epimerase [Halocola ammonii]